MSFFGHAFDIYSFFTKRAFSGFRRKIISNQIYNAMLDPLLGNIYVTNLMIMHLYAFMCIIFAYLDYVSINYDLSLRTKI